MRILSNSSDAAILTEIGARIAAARLELNFTQGALAGKAGVSRRTVERIEAGAGAQLAGFVRICRALGIVERLEALLPEQGPSPIEQLKLRGKRRRRASGGRGESRGGAPWTWGDEP